MGHILLLHNNRYHSNRKYMVVYQFKEYNKTFHNCIFYFSVIPTVDFRIQKLIEVQFITIIAMKNRRYMINQKKKIEVIAIT